MTLFQMPKLARTASCVAASSIALGMIGCGMGMGSDDDESAPTGAYGGPYGMGGAGADYQDGEQYTDYGENEFIETTTEPTSTFGADVDTASYSIMRRDITNGTLPVPAGVRVEEYVNYFKYDYPYPETEPFSIALEMAPSVFGEEGQQLFRIGIKAREVPPEERDPANLVFLIDVSGSMGTANKLPLVAWSLKQLTNKLLPTDTLGIVVYASRDGVLLEPTAVENKATVLDAIDTLTAGGSTAGEAGIRRAYEMAENAFRPGGVNRVVLCTDGDFNVGLTGAPLVSLIEDYRDRGINLSVLGFGMGNINDSTMEQLADNGNGNYAYIDSQNEALRVLGENLVSTLQVVAKDVKLQVEFDPATVARYRLVGYENRVMSNDDFINDAKDSGDIGAGHNVTAFYELELVPDAVEGRVSVVRVRHKHPEGDVSEEIVREFSLAGRAPNFESASDGFRFAAAVTEYAEILRQSKHSTGARFGDIIAIANGTPVGHTERTEFVSLVETASVHHSSQ